MSAWQPTDSTVNGQVDLKATISGYALINAPDVNSDGDGLFDYSADYLNASKTGSASDSFLIKSITPGETWDSNPFTASSPTIAGVINELLQTSGWDTSNHNILLFMTVTTDDTAANFDLSLDKNELGVHFKGMSVYLNYT